MEEEKYIGFIKYDGRLVKEGLMDARQQAQALLGFDSAIRHFIGKQAPDFRNIDFEMPVRIKKGSWEALIPVTVADWLQASLGIAATAYLTTAAKNMAEKDFKGFGFTVLFKNAVLYLKWFAKIGMHLGDATIRLFPDVKFKDDNALIGIRNSEGQYLYVPKYILDMYVTSSPKLLEKLAGNISEGRTLKIGSISAEGEIDEISVTHREKSIFCEDETEQDEDILFPELIHGADVVLEGEVTKENKTEHSMGFKYEDHILTAYPKSGNIVPYKPMLFLKCRLYGLVSRLDKNGRITARRPKLIFKRLEPLEEEIENDLFK